MTIVVDTDVLIDLLYKREPSTRHLRALRDSGETLATTSVNAGELWRGARTAEARAMVAKLLAALHEVPYDRRAARRFGEIMEALDRAGSSLGNTDGMIAAATLETGGRIVTRNAKEFRRVPGLEVVVPK